jgi:ribosomal protein S12 methylthiotransferase accessory factor YcaO
MRFSYLVVEGPHDVEAIGRILKKFGFVRVENIANLNELWIPMIPRQYPPDRCVC